MHVISEPNVVEASGSVTFEFGLSMHTGAHGESGDTCIAHVKSVNMKNKKTEARARRVMLYDLRGR